MECQRCHKEISDEQNDLVIAFFSDNTKEFYHKCCYNEWMNEYRPFGEIPYGFVQAKYNIKTR